MRAMYLRKICFLPINLYCLAYYLTQIQELGDLQQALNMKNEYRTMQRSLQHKTKQYQEAMCEKMELQKQVRNSGNYPVSVDSMKCALNSTLLYQYLLPDSSIFRTLL